MALFPLKAPLSLDELIKTTCKLYRQSLFKALPITLGLIAMFDFILYGSYLFPKAYVYLHPQIALFVVVIMLTTTGTMFCAIDTVGKAKPFSYGKLIIFTLQRFLPLAGCLFSMLLLPALIAGFCAGVYFFLGYNNFAQPILFAWFMFSSLILFAVFVPKLFAPLLVFIDSLSANDSLDESARIVKGCFARCFELTLFASLILLFFAVLGHLFLAYIPALKTLPFGVVEGVSQILLLLNAPWAFALLLTLKYDLQQRHPSLEVNKVEKPKIKEPQSVRATTSEGDEDKYNF
ncbi:MAG: hypothetical protein JSR17_00220 [Proteobacteria bacterium]|nr:hypothetical protein [Pseudomonadota bacterium]